MVNTAIVTELSNFIWSVADLLRGPYRPPQYERVMLPMTVLRRFDSVLEPTKEAVRAKYLELERKGSVERLGNNIDRQLNEIAGQGFHNRSQFTFTKLLGEPDKVDQHLMNYVEGFSANVRTIFRYFDFEKEVEKLSESNRLFLIIQRFAAIDLHTRRVDNIEMGLLFEDLIRRFNEAANETAGDHFTPREVIQLMVNVLLEPDGEALRKAGKIITIYDPTCGTGGMLSEGQTWLREHNTSATVQVYGQDYNPRSYAVAASDLLMKRKPGEPEYSLIKFGNTLTNDQFDGIKDPNLPPRFNYLLANPPFGVDWKGQQDIIESEHKTARYNGRFGPKLPRVNDGALLFLLHMISKFQLAKETADTLENGSRAAVVFNGSPLFTGGAGSGESEIRRWIIENDWLEAIIALPEQMFYNTGIGTFIWVVTNRKTNERRGKIQLIDARERWTPMRRSLGDKRRYLSDETIDDITREHGHFEKAKTKHSKVYPNAYFGYRRITVECPLRLRFQITQEAKEQFLEAAPHFLDMLRELESKVGTKPYLDWNPIWEIAEPLAKKTGTKWGTSSRKLFRTTFCTTDPEAKPVILKKAGNLGVIEATHFPNHAMPDKNKLQLDKLFGVAVTEDKKRVIYEADPALRDFENVPLLEHPVTFFEREVLPFVPDAWIDPDAADEKDGGVGKKGFEINFNREFFSYDPPRELETIDKELSDVEARILKLLQEVTA